MHICIIDIQMSLMDLEVRMKRVEDIQQQILQQLTYHHYPFRSPLPSSGLPFPNTTPYPPYPTFAPIPDFQSSSFLSPSNIPNILKSPPKSQPPAPSTPNRRYASSNFVSPLPLSKLPPTAKALPSSAIKNDKLVTVEKVTEKYPKLKEECKAGTLACKIAKEALFGPEVMMQCTPIGNRELPGLPTKELQQLKKTMFSRFPQYWNNPVEFEPVWKKCLESVQQGCKRLRLGKDKD